jgi:5-carboxymethyl-2-hydroxymuconate isomerase
MPHIVLEYSANLELPPDFNQVLLEIHELLPKVGPFDPLSLKGRVIKHEVFRIADGEEKTAFVHLQVAIMEGRSEEVRQTVSSALLKLLETIFDSQLKKQKLSITVEIRELNRNSYSKSSSTGG